MKFYFLQTTGNLNDEDQLFLENPPEELGILDYYPAVGERVGPIRSGALTLRANSGGDIHDIIGNSRGYFLGSERLKTFLEEYFRSMTGPEIEYLPVSIYSHDNILLADNYYFINPLGDFDCLHEGQSRIIRDAEGKILSLGDLVLDQKKMTRAPDLFRVQGRPMWYVFSLKLGLAMKKERITNLAGEEIPMA